MKSFWRVLKNTKFIRWKDKALRWIRSVSYKVVLDFITSKLSFGATNDLPSDNWLNLPLLRSLNEGDLREDNILEAWNSTTTFSSNNVSAPSKCLRFIEPSIRPLIASCMFKASREDWLRINLARRILLVKAKKKVVNSYSDLSYCHPFNGLLY
ncbi:hypothetical protein ACOME3_002998 [Neoechinorhynchus agilis]